MKIELLYFDGCPSWQTGLDNLRSALRAEGLNVPVELVEVLNDDDAAQKKIFWLAIFSCGWCRTMG
jgi:hypothetical protein